MMHLLRSSSEFRAFSNYLKGECLISKESLNNQDPEILWDIFIDTAPKLSRLGLVSQSSNF